jgi:hypothetical protein
MKNQNFIALCLLTTLYCVGFAIIALVLLVARLVQGGEPSTVVDAQSLAPIFERECAESPSLIVASRLKDQALSAPISMPRKPKARTSKLSALIVEEVTRLDKAML